MMLRIFDRRIVDAHHLARGLVLGHAALGAGNHQILDANIGESAAGHDAVVAAPRPVTVEVFKRNAVVEQVFSCRRAFLDGSRRGDVIRRHAIAKDAQGAGSFDLADLPRRGAWGSVTAKNFPNALGGAFEQAIVKAAKKRGVG